LAGDRLRLRLANGSICRIRPSGEGDRQRLLDFFNALSPESRRLRFFSSKQHLSAAELDLFAGADGHDHLAFAAVRLDERGREQEALGFARCIRLQPSGDRAEFSVTVADRHQGQGLGSTLLKQVAAGAQAVGIRHLQTEVLAENTSMRHLAKHLGCEARWLGDGIVEYDCTLPEAPARSPWGLPWFADPDRLFDAVTEAWLQRLDDSLALTQRASDRLERWLTELDAAQAAA
jgi:RimJ/RimL family protein N-acetyltransferase